MTLWVATEWFALLGPRPSPPQLQSLKELLRRPSHRPRGRAGLGRCLMVTTLPSAWTLLLGRGAGEQEVSGRGRRRTGANMVDYQYCTVFMSGPLSCLEATGLEQKEKIASGKCCKWGYEIIPALSYNVPFYTTNCLRKKRHWWIFLPPLLALKS